MNRSQAKELIPILQAYAEGKEIQSRWGKEDSWADVICTDFSFENGYEYRIKPESREFWVSTCSIDGMFAHSQVEPKDTGIAWIKVREVIEDGDL